MKHLFIGNLFKIAENSSNCEDDIDEVLKCIKENNAVPIRNTFYRKNKSPIRNAINYPSDCFIDIMAENAYFYVSGCIANKIRSFHNCKQCQIISDNASLQSKEQLFIFFFKVKCKTETDCGKLTVPTNEFFSFIKRCKILFSDDIRAILHEKDIS